jgi:CTP synthase
VEAIELDDHPFFLASQFHPEFKSRPERPAPMFRGFIAAALERARCQVQAAADQGPGQAEPGGDSGNSRRLAAQS